MPRTRRSAALVALALLCGCGGTLRVAVGPTVDTTGNVGVLARVGGGFAGGVKKRGAMQMTQHIAGGGGGDFAMLGTEMAVEYLHEPADSDAVSDKSIWVETGRRPRSLEKPAFRTGLHGGYYRVRGGQFPSTAFVGATIALLGTVHARESSSSTTIVRSSHEKYGGFSIHTDWSQRVFVGAELDCDLLLLSRGVKDAPFLDALAGRFSLLFALDYAMISR